MAFERFHGTCIVCFKPESKNVVAFAGSGEWAAAGLVALGVPQDQAIATVEMYPPSAQEGFDSVACFLVCATCARRSPFDAGKVYTEPDNLGLLLDAE